MSILSLVVLFVHTNVTERILMKAGDWVRNHAKKKQFHFDADPRKGAVQIPQVLILFCTVICFSVSDV